MSTILSARMKTDKVLKEFDNFFKEKKKTEYLTKGQLIELALKSYMEHEGWYDTKQGGGDDQDQGRPSQGGGHSFFLGAENDGSAMVSSVSQNGQYEEYASYIMGKYNDGAVLNRGLLRREMMQLQNHSSGTALTDRIESMLCLGILDEGLEPGDYILSKKDDLGF